MFVGEGSVSFREDFIGKDFIKKDFIGKDFRGQTSSFEIVWVKALAGAWTFNLY